MPHYLKITKVDFTQILPFGKNVKIKYKNASLPDIDANWVDTGNHPVKEDGTFVSPLFLTTGITPGETYTVWAIPEGGLTGKKQNFLYTPPTTLPATTVPATTAPATTAPATTAPATTAPATTTEAATTTAPATTAPATTAPATTAPATTTEAATTTAPATTTEAFITFNISAGNSLGEPCGGTNLRTVRLSDNTDVLAPGKTVYRLPQNIALTGFTHITLWDGAPAGQIFTIDTNNGQILSNTGNSC